MNESFGGRMNEIQVAYQSGSTLYVLIRNAAGSVYQTTTAGFVTYDAGNLSTYAIALTDDGGGFYTADFPTAISAPATYAVVAYVRAGGSPATDDTAVASGEIVWSGSELDTTPLGLDLITLSYAKSVCGITGSDRDSFLASLISACSSAVCRYCGRQFRSQSFTEYYDGKGYGDTDLYYGGSRFNWTLTLRNFPIVELTQVTLWPYDAAQTEVIPGTDFVVDSRLGEIRLRNDSAHTALFPPGFQTTKVEYVAGYDDVPDDVQLACALMVKNSLDVAATDLTKDAESIGPGGYSYQLRAGSFASMVTSPEVKELLNRYRVVGV